MSDGMKERKGGQGEMMIEGIVVIGECVRGGWCDGLVGEDSKVFCVCFV